MISWFLSGQDFTVQTVSSETDKPCILVQKQENSKLANSILEPYNIKLIIKFQYLIMLCFISRAG